MHVARILARPPPNARRSRAAPPGERGRALAVLAAVGVVLAVFTPPAHAVTTFYLSTGGSPSGDNAWQNAVGNVFVEFDFDNFANGATIDSLAAGPVVIDVGLAGNRTAGAAEAFWGSFTGGQYGTVRGGTVLNRDPSNRAFGPHTQITFDFSVPVQGFGTWIYDNDAGSRDSFRMIVTEVGGAPTLSSVLESGNGLSHAVEGFIGATSDVGITKVAIEVLDQLTGSPDPAYFELDHVQVAVPEPLTMLGVFLGVSGLAAYIRRRRPA